MASPILLLTAIEAGFGFLLTCTILYLVLSRGRETYHFLFAAFLLLCAIWDLGTFLLVTRNQHPGELVVIGYVIGVPCAFIPALIFHFAVEYTGRRLKWAVALLWGICALFVLLSLAGLYWVVDGVYSYHWGDVFRVLPTVVGPWVMLAWFVPNLAASWMLFVAARRAASPLERRHSLYVAWGLLAITFAVVKVGVVMGIDIPVLLPLGMFLVDMFNAIIGLAIIKDRLFDITVFVKKGAVFSVLGGLLIFLYSFTEHLLVSYVGESIGEGSTLLHFVSIGVGIAVLLPVKSKLERAIDGYFAQRQVQF
jgi:hypothetical protein